MSRLEDSSLARDDRRSIRSGGKTGDQTISKNLLEKSLSKMAPLKASSRSGVQGFWLKRLTKFKRLRTQLQELFIEWEPASLHDHPNCMF